MSGSPTTRKRLRSLVTEIDDAVVRYRTTQRTSDTEQLRRLGRIRDRVALLIAELDSLFRDAKTLLGIADWPLPRGVKLKTLHEELRLLLTQTEYALRHASRPRRGPRNQDTFRRLVGELAVLWMLENPEVEKGVVAVNGEHRGPMLEFVWKRLRRKRIRVRSKAALGKMMYEMRSKVARFAATARAKRTVTRKIGQTTVISRE